MANAALLAITTDTGSFKYSMPFFKLLIAVKMAKNVNC